jgi:hypothetical protein
MVEARATGITGIYDNLRDEVFQAIAFRERLLRRTAKWPRSWVVVRLSGLNPTAKLPEGVQAKMLERASETDRSHPLFRRVTAPYWVEELSAHCHAMFRFDRDRLEALSAIQEEREVAFVGFYQHFKFGTMVPLIIGVLGFLASQIPKESFEVLGLPQWYGWYRLAVIATLVVLLAYAAQLSQIARRASRRTLGATRIVGLVLRICAINGPPILEIGGATAASTTEQTDETL